MSFSKLCESVTSETLRGIWSDTETEFFIALIKENNVVSELDGKKNRNSEIYKKLVPLMRDAGFPRTLEQLRVKWKHLQAAYRKTRDTNKISGTGKATCSYYEELNDILFSRPNATTLLNACDSLSMSQGLDVTPSTFVVNDSGVLEPALFVETYSDEPSSSFNRSDCSSPSPGVVGTKQRASGHKHKGNQSFLVATERMLDKNSKDKESFWRDELNKQRDWEEKQQAKLITAQTDVMKNFMNCMNQMAQPTPAPIPNFQYQMPYPPYHQHYQVPSKPNVEEDIKHKDE